jgi:hypothetical protein
VTPAGSIRRAAGGPSPLTVSTGISDTRTLAPATFWHTGSPARRRQTHTRGDRVTPASSRQPSANTDRRCVTPPSRATAASAHAPSLRALPPTLHGRAADKVTTTAAQTRPLRSCPAVAHRCFSVVEAALERSRRGPAVAHRCFSVVEAALERSRRGPAVAHRCFSAVEAALEYSRRDPAVVYRCLSVVEAALERSRRGPAVAHRCLSAGEAALESSCLSAVEAALESSRRGPAVVYRCFGGAENLGVVNQGSEGESARFWRALGVPERGVDLWG